MKYKNPIPSLDLSDNDRNDVGIGTCDFCGKDNVTVASTSVRGLSCKGCADIVMYECKEAIKAIKEFEGKGRRKTTRSTKAILTINEQLAKAEKEMTEKKEQLIELEREKDESLAKLFSGDYTKKTDN